MAIGMTYDQYWHCDPLMVRAFYKADQIRQKRINEEAWLYGAYFYSALNATVGNVLRKKGTKPAEYPQKPFDMDDRSVETDFEREQREEREALFAQAYMENMVLAGKNWGKKE